MAEVKVYNPAGKEVETLNLDDKLFGLPWNGDLVHQVVSSMMGNQRTRVADVKDRGEVRGGGKKPWRQKGTGNARHGSRRSPIWVGGGVTHGPTSEKNFSKKINKKMKTKAFFTILSQKLRDNELVLVDSIELKAPKTKEAQGYLNNLAKAGIEKINYKKGKRALLAWPSKSTEAEKSFKNIASAEVKELRNVSPLDLITYKYLVINDPKKSLDILTAKQK